MDEKLYEKYKEKYPEEEWVDTTKQRLENGVEGVLKAKISHSIVKTVHKIISNREDEWAFYEYYLTERFTSQHLIELGQDIADDLVNL